MPIYDVIYEANYDDAHLIWEVTADNLDLALQAAHDHNEHGEKILSVSERQLGFLDEWRKAQGDSNQDYVLQRWPGATCFKTKLYWPGQEREKFIVTSSPIMSRSEAEADTAQEAWAQAAERLRSKKTEPVEISFQLRPEQPLSDWVWHSNCVAHTEYVKCCRACNKGAWVSSMERTNVSGWRRWLRDNVWSKK